MVNYRLVSEWLLRAPIKAVWDELFHSERWPQWWYGLEHVEQLETGDADGIGSVRRFTWKGALPYRLVVDMRLTRTDPYRLLESRATGELEGNGRWVLSEQGGMTRARYEWDVETMKPWMNRLAPLFRPFFEWNHDVVMRGGERGLKKLLERR